MTDIASDRMRRQLVAALRARGTLRSPRVETAFLSVGREHFLPATLAEGGLKAVYRDDAIVTKRDARGLPLSSSSQPAIMAEMLELLDVPPGARVLEIGAGTGYNAALLKHLVGRSGTVTSIDIDPELASGARRALRDAGVRVRVVVGDGRDGHAAGAPYDRIIATAGADEIPRAWLQQLTDGGLVELPLRLDPDGEGIQLIPVLRREGAQLRSVGLTWGGFMPLHGGDGGHRAPRATLSAAHHVGETYLGLAHLTGGGIERLTPPAARRLLAELLAEPGRAPRRTGLTDLAPRRPPRLLLFLLLNVAPERRLSFRAAGRWGIGHVDARGRSAAIVSLRSPWREDPKPPPRARWRLDGYGGDTAADELDQLLATWREHDRDGRSALQITAHGRTRALALRFAWT